MKIHKWITCLWRDHLWSTPVPIRELGGYTVVSRTCQHCGRTATFI